MRSNDDFWRHHLDWCGNLNGDNKIAILIKYRISKHIKVKENDLNKYFNSARNFKFALYLFSRSERYWISVLWNIIIKFLRNNRRTRWAIRNRSNVSISLHILYCTSITAKTNVMVNFYELCAIGWNSTWNMMKECAHESQTFLFSHSDLIYQNNSMQ